MRQIAGVLAVFTIGGIAWWLVDGINREVDPLPLESDIEMIIAEYPVIGGNDTFSVPHNQWRSIFDSLLPAREDAAPAKWEVMGVLTIILKNGREFRVFLFDTGHGAGAFAAGETWDNRTYYRGGSSERLRLSLLDAMKANNSQPLPKRNN